MQIIQKELDQIRKEWNEHRSRFSSGAECPGGKPNILYDVPQLYGKKYFGRNVL